MNEPGIVEVDTASRSSTLRSGFGQGGGEAQIERVPRISYEKEPIYNVMRVAFTDGSVIALDAGKGQRLDDLAASVGLARG